MGTLLDFLDVFSLFFFFSDGKATVQVNSTFQEDFFYLISLRERERERKESCFVSVLIFIKYKSGEEARNINHYLFRIHHGSLSVSSSI